MGRTVFNNVSMAQLNETLSDCGWALLDGVTDAGELLLLGETLGTPIAPPNRELVQQLVPTASADAAPNTYSQRYGHGFFPFHTDLANWRTPPRLLLLRNAGSASAVPTLLADVLPGMPSKLKADLERASFRTRGHGPSFLCSALMRQYGRVQIRWDADAMVGIDQFSIDVATQFGHYLAELSTVDYNAVPWSSNGRVLLIDNWRLLHARPPSGSEVNRRLERVLIN